MRLFGKKEKIILSEYQKDKLVEKLEDANIKYTLNIHDNDSFKKETLYEVRLYAEDLKKVV
ncbi:MAG: hypothetical protein K6B68_01670 [Eubacterium sp.]|nr:hypothetical protein [Eubacterium sp.]